MKPLFILFLTIGFAACDPKHSAVKLNVMVKTPAGDPVAEAVVSINRNIVGDTNAFGTFKWEFDTKQGSKHRIEIRKQGETYYFAPHLETVVIPKKQDFEWNIHATMYMAPKPKVDKNLEPESPPSKENTDLVNVDQVAESTLDATSFIVPVASGATPFYYRPIETMAVKTTSPDSETFSVFTAHIYSGKVPVEDATLYACLDGVGLRTLCTSNSRGRCVIKLEAADRPRRMSLVARRNGFITLHSEGPFENGSNLRLNLSSGHSLDVATQYQIYGKVFPAQKVSLSTPHSPSIAETNHCGFASFRTAKFAEDYRVSAASSGIKGGRTEFNIAGSDLPRINLPPEHLPTPALAIRPIMPGKGVTQADALKFLTSENTARLTQDLQKAFSALGVSTHNSLVQDMLLDTTTHNLELYLFRDGESLYLAANLSSANSEFIAASKVPLGVVLEEQAATTSVLAEIIIRKLGETSQTTGNDLAFRPSGRWLWAASEPKFSEMTWAESTMRLPNSDAPVEIGEAEKVTLVAPPGYVNIEMTLPKDVLWLDLRSEAGLKFEKNHLAVITEWAKAGDLAAMERVLSEIPKTHSQWLDAHVLKAIVEAKVGKIDPATLTPIADQNMERSAQSANRLNAVTANVMLSSLESLPKDVRLQRAKRAIAAVSDLLPAINSQGDAELISLAIVQHGLAKSVAAALEGDAVLAADSEADLKEYLRRSEAQADKPRTRFLRIAATKNLRSLDRQ